MSIVYMFIPAIAWGILPLAVAKVKGKPINQILGTTVGTLIVGIITLPFINANFDTKTFWLAALAGAFWVIGQLGQYTGYAKIGVSETMPLSTGLQLIGVPLVGVLAFGEWSSPQAKLYGFIGILVLIIGVVLTSLTDRGTSEGNKSNQVSTIILLVLTSLGYITSSSIPKALHGNSISIFFGQTFGMLVAVFIYTLVTKNLHVWKEKSTVQSGGAGILYAIAALAYILSVQDNGVNMAFVISQLCVVISTLGGLIFLHEKKTRKGLIFTIAGLILIIGGAMLTTLF